MVDITSRLRLVVDSSGVDRAGNKLKDLRAEARRAQETAKALQGAFMSLGAIVATVLSVDAVVRFADSWKRAENQIKTVEKSLISLRSAQEGVFSISQRTYSSYEATATLYTRLTRSAGGLLANQKEALRVVETVNKALAVGGASGPERASVITQLGQAVGSGRLQGDEFRSISENAPLIMDALAKSTGKARGELKQLGSDGKITSEVLIKALKDYSKEVDATYGNFAPTIGDAIQKLQNAFSKFIGTNGAGLFDGLAKGISLLADNLDLVAKAAVIALPAMLALAGPQILAGLGAVANGIKAIGVAIASNPLGALAVAITTAATAFYVFSDSMKVAGKEAETYGVTVQDVLNEIPGLVGDTIGSLASDFGNWFAGLFGAVQIDEINAFWGKIGEGAYKVINAIIGQWVTGFNIIKAVFTKFPRIMGDLFFSAANMAISGIEYLVNNSIKLVNDFGDKAQKALSSVGLKIDVPDIAPVAMQLKNKFAGEMAAIIDPAIKAVSGQVDYLGQIGGQLTERATKRKKAQAAAEKALVGSEAGKTVPGATPEKDKENERRAKQLKEQLADYNRLFGEAAKMRDAALIGEHEVEVVDQMLGLLDRFPLVYAAMGYKAKESARADAEKLVSLKEQAKAAQALRDIQKQVDDPKRRAAAFAKGGYSELQISDKTQELIKSGAFDFNTDKTKRTADEIERAARQMAMAAIEAEKLGESIDRAADRAKFLAPENIAKRFGDDLEGIFDQFFNDLPKNGGEAIKSLFANLGQATSMAISDALKLAAEPFISKVRDGLKKAMSDAIGSFGKDGEKGKGILGALQGLGEKIFGKGGLAKISSAVSTGIQTIGAAQVGSQISSVLGGNTTSAQQKNGQAGALIGAAIGSFIPVIGTVLGSLLGSALGGLLGPSSTNAAASSILDASGKSTSGILGTKRTDETTGALTAAISALQAGYKSISDLGGTMTTYVRNLEIGQRDQSRVDLSNGQTVFTAVGDTAAAANAGLLAVLKGTTFAADELNRLKDAMISAGSSFDDTFVAIQKVDALLKSTQPAMSDYAKALADFQKTLTGQALDVAKQALGSAFAKDAAQQRLELENPTGAAMKATAEAVASFIKDAIALNQAIGQGSDVFVVATANLSKVFDQSFSNISSAADLAKELENLKQVLQSAGVSAEYAAAAIEGAIKNQRDALNKDVLSQIQGYLTDPLDQLNALLKSQAERLEKAKLYGADIANVERLTALELRNFFTGLSDDALKEVEGFLGLFDKATNDVVKNLDLSRQDLKGQADAFQGFAEQFKQLNTDLTQQYLTASPRESMGVLRGRVTELLGGVAAGNQSAARALPQVVQKLVDAARASFGNTKEFADVLAFAQSSLATAEQSALNVKSDAERQIAALDANNDILSDIRDILQSSQATNAFFQSYVSGGVASSDALLSLIQQGTGNTASNANASALNITGLIAQTVQPVIQPIANSIDAFTARLGDLPSLQRRTIEAIEAGSRNVVSALDGVADLLDKIEQLEKRQLAELEQANGKKVA